MTKWRRLLYHPNLPLGPDGKRVTACEEHIALSKNAAKEGMVLLKNQGALLPFAKGTKLALFGKGTFDYVKGGGGSGDVTVEYIINLYEGLKKMDGHVDIFENLADYYRAYVQEKYDEGCLPGQLPEPKLPDALCSKARAFSDTAVISISRFSGEGWDRHLKGHELFEDGDFYLSYAERKMVEKVKKYFPKIVVVMNVGGMVDTQWFYADDAIGSVLMAWQGGLEGGTAAAELLCGYGNPCGKLVDTFAKKLEDYPSTANFHESDDYVEYTDDIYVGYRYFETIPGAADRVNYPFGFGLSYTTFAWTISEFTHNGDCFDLKVTVWNMGDCAGKEVLQVYVCAPQGRLGKAKRSLVAFQKTKLLEPGCSQELTLHWDMAVMASFDDLGKVQPFAYVLEKGEYSFHVGTSVRDTLRCEETFCLDEDKVVEQLSAKLVPTQLKKRLLADGTYEMLAISAPQPCVPDGLKPLTEYDFEHAEAYDGIFFYLPHAVEMMLELFGYDPISVNTMVLSHNNFIVCVKYAQFTVNLAINGYPPAITAVGSKKSEVVQIDDTDVFAQCMGNFISNIRQKKVTKDTSQLTRHVQVILAIKESMEKNTDVTIGA